MDKEMTNNIVSFDVREKGETPPRGYKDMTVHVIVYVNLDYGFTWKARFVADGHNFDTPP